ncbi:alpha/beta fold hydrolase [Maritimibacter sp. DP1N21-5]|uniref:alpha/beta fold hydrolase n=1 Tax=Maritimibacter sp. DP1N21-5 TaxID=2836867 RepID=UPI001C468B96|nr:alpha/beta hydrolase [Maritimibacter sp. DP1N21-5]MBV7407360.1 alpha/beta hydrolase [Maritimibacter sp. DP1N21-5]
MTLMWIEDGATAMDWTMDDGVRIVGEAFGDPSAPSVLLIHGGGQTRYAWSRVAKRLGRAGYYAVAIDLRGHGESDWDEAQDYRTERFGQDTATIARSFAVPPVLVGASLGGNSGMFAVGRFAPEAFRGLVLVDITPQIDAKGSEKVTGFLGERMDEGFASFEEAAAAIAAYLPERRGRASNIDSLARYLRQRPDGRYRWHWDPAFIEGRASSRLRPETVAELNEALAAIRVPVLLVRGSNSELVNDESVAAFLRVKPEARFVDVTGAGHMIVGDRNDVFAETLDGFLKDL